MEQKRALIGKTEHKPFIDPREFQAFVAKSEADFVAQLAEQRGKARGALSSSAMEIPRAIARDERSLSRCEAGPLEMRRDPHTRIAGFRRCTRF